MKTKVFIKENSFIAFLAAKRMKSSSVALVIGKTIHLYGVNKNIFLQNKYWVAHELVHVEQYKRIGKFAFLSQYFYEWILKGYYNISFEIEARDKEMNTSIIEQYEFV